eukprot:scaffold7082_cov144-Skeletonema_marinoi.AAC.1
MSQRELVGAMEKSQMRRRSKITSSDHRSMHHTSSHLLGDSYTVYYMCNLLKNSEGDNPLEDWSIFYCGGSSKMKDDLKAISKKYTIDLSAQRSYGITLQLSGDHVGSIKDVTKMRQNSSGNATHHTSEQAHSISCLDAKYNEV